MFGLLVWICLVWRFVWFIVGLDLLDFCWFGDLFVSVKYASFEPQLP